MVITHAMVRILRILLPFLFVRNWYSGDWELSTPRLWLFAAAVVLVITAFAVILVLQAPLEYTAPGAT